MTPEDAGLPKANSDDLKGGAPEVNAKAMKDMLAGGTGPFRDVVLYNAAAALMVADKAETLSKGVALAAAAIDDGRAMETLDKLVAVTNS